MQCLFNELLLPFSKKLTACIALVPPNKHKLIAKCLFYYKDHLVAKLIQEMFFISQHMYYLLPFSPIKIVVATYMLNEAFANFFLNWKLGIELFVGFQYLICKDLTIGEGTENVELLQRVIGKEELCDICYDLTSVNNHARPFLDFLILENIITNGKLENVDKQLL